MLVVGLLAWWLRWSLCVRAHGINSQQCIPMSSRTQHECQSQLIYIAGSPHTAGTPKSIAYIPGIPQTTEAHRRSTKFNHLHSRSTKVNDLHNTSTKVNNLEKRSTKVNNLQMRSTKVNHLYNRSSKDNCLHNTSSKVNHLIIALFAHHERQGGPWNEMARSNTEVEEDVTEDEEEDDEEEKEEDDEDEE